MQALLTKSGADLVIHGEADHSIVELVRGATKTGTAWLEPTPDGTAPQFRFDEGEPVRDLNLLPFPARDLLPNDRYCYPLLGGPVATVQTSRGCPYPCGFYCPYPLVKGVKWRAQSADRIASELRDIVEAADERPVKVILETCLLTDEQKIRACKLVVEAGAHFVKTSTGFSKSGATLEDVKLLRQEVGKDFGVKASGGIRDAVTALAMIEAGATRLGTSNGVAIVKGSSSGGAY